MSKNLLAKFYQENKERLPKKSRERYQNLSNEEKEKKLQYGRERYKNLSKDEMFFKTFLKCLKIYQLNSIKKIKKDCQKKVVKDIKIFLMKNKKKSYNMVVSVTKTSQKMKKINWLSIERNIIE